MVCTRATVHTMDGLVKLQVAFIDHQRRIIHELLTRVSRQTEDIGWLVVILHLLMDIPQQGATETSYVDGKESYYLLPRIPIKPGRERFVKYSQVPMSQRWEVKHADGRVGTHRAELYTRTMGDTVRVDCAKNPEFWLEIDTRCLKARGRTELEMNGIGKFVARMTPTGIRVDHTTCPAFWLELTL